MLDRIAIVTLALGAGSVVTRLLPAADAAQTLRRIVPLLLFLGAVIVLAELTAKAEVFALSWWPPSAGCSRAAICSEPR